MTDRRQIRILLAATADATARVRGSGANSDPVARTQALPKNQHTPGRQTPQGLRYCLEQLSNEALRG